MKRIEPRIKCFITAKVKQADKSLRQNGLVSFAIPDWGILFRASYVGSYYELEYMSLLSLLRFVELNRPAFENHKIDIYSTSSILVYQVSQNAFCQKEIERHKNLAVAYKNIIDFSLNWIPQSENRAETGMLDLSPLKSSPNRKDAGLNTTNLPSDRASGRGQNASFDFDFEDIHKKLK
jgi:hypothetical protein